MIVPAAGSGSRYGPGLPKQYALLDGRPLIFHTLERMRSLQPVALVVALAPDDAAWEQRIGGAPGVEIARCGGATRAATVRNALDTLASRCGDDDFVAVHDAARACVPLDALQRLVAALADEPLAREDPAWAIGRAAIARRPLPPGGDNAAIGADVQMVILR